MTRSQMLQILRQAGFASAVLDTMTDPQLSEVVRVLGGQTGSLSPASPGYSGPSMPLSERALRGRVATLERQRKAARVAKLCERLVGERRLAPGEVGVTAAQLMRADDVRPVTRFSEGGRVVALTEYQTQVRALCRRPPIPVSAAPTTVNPLAERRKVESFAERNAADLAKMGSSPAKLINTFVRTQQRRPGVTAAEFGVR